MQVFKLPKLFGISKKGKVKSWKISIEYDGGYPIVFIEHGYEDGKKQRSGKPISVGKNIGKSNETSPWQQAVLEVRAAWKKKQDKNYFVRPCKKNEAMLPMLAFEYGARKHDIVFPCYAQPKLNGVRCLARMKEDGSILFTSRGGKGFMRLHHIEEALREFMLPGDVFDGELYTHGMLFENIVSAVKAGKEENPETIKVGYHIYDFPSHGGELFERIESLYGKVPRYDDSPIKLVSTKEVSNEEDLYLIHDNFIDDKYEGTMIRNKLGFYLFGHRSNDLQKLKDMMDEEFEIVGGNEGIGKSVGQCTFLCVNREEKIFGVRCIGAKGVRIEQWNNLDDYVGKFISVKFQNYSKEGIPIFPVGMSIREGSVDMNGKFIPHY